MFLFCIADACSMHDDFAYARTQCEVRVTDANSKKTYSFDYKVGQNGAILELPEGAFYLDNMYCGNKGKTNLTRLPMSHFRVFKGKLTVIEPFGLHRTRDIDYWQIGQAERAIGITNMDFELSKAQKARLVDPHSGAPFILQ